MKVKLQFDKRRIQEFLLLNAEKIGAGVVVVGALLILYFSLKWYWDERFTRTTDMLLTASENAKKTIGNTPPPTLDVADYVAQAKRSRVPVVEQPYDYPVAWDKPLFEMPSLRGEPSLLAARQLRGTAEFGTFRIAPVHPADDKAGRGETGRGEKRRPTPVAPVAIADDNCGKRWIVLTALVPFAEQEAAYLDTFSQSANVYHDVMSDTPKYLGYWVERLEVTSPADAANPDWEKAKTIRSDEARKAAITEWAGAQATGAPALGMMGTDIVLTDYVDPALVFPLAPLVNRRWTASAAHEPEIPMLRTPGPLGDMSMEPIPGDRQPVRTAPGGPIPDEGPFSDARALDPERLAAPPPDMARPGQEKKPYKLLRFFDFNVEPGKQYIYRVRLALANPNRSAALKPSLLKDPKLADKKLLETNWSEPSPVIAVPLDWHVFLVRVTPPTRVGSDTAELVVTKWKPEKGMECYNNFPVSRGQMVCFPDSRGKPLTTIPGAFSPDESSPIIEPDVTASPTVRKSVLADFITDVTALDFRGGERLSRKRGSTLTAAGEILLMNADGTLTVHNELEDTTAWDHYQNPGTEAKPKPDQAGSAAAPARTTLDTASR